MTAVHIGLGVLLIAFNLAAGLWGAWCWWRHEQSRAFWILLRIGQGLVMLQAIDGVALLALGRELPHLHLIYGLVPLGVSLIAEQLRLVSAQTVLDQRGLENAQALRRRSEAEQQEVVDAILRRELGVMAASALVVTALALRATTLI
jgi:hypothetical protein